MDTIYIEKILEKHQHDHGGLISILEEIQAKYSYLPEEALRIVAEKTGRSLVDIYGVATFYKAFSLKPRGRHLISCCQGTACHVRGAHNTLREVEKQLSVKPGETTANREFTLESVNCLGACALGPVVVVDGHYFANVKTSMVQDILTRAGKGLDTVDINTDQRIFPVELSCAHCNHSLMDPRQIIDGHPSICITISLGQNHGWLALSCLYGSYNIASDFEVPNDAVVHMFCPHCHAELRGGGACGDCGAPMVPMIVRGGGIVQICTRRGCKNHILDLTGTTMT